jgi:hypothetical protein
MHLEFYRHFDLKSFNIYGILLSFYKVLFLINKKDFVYSHG